MCSCVLFMMVGSNPPYVYQCVPVFCLWWLVPFLPMFINVFLCSVYDGWFHSSLCLSMCSCVLFMMVGSNPPYVYQCVPVFCLWWLVPFLPIFINVFLCSVYDGWFHSSLCLSMCSYVLFMMVGSIPPYVYQCVPVFCLWWLVLILPMFINVFLCSVYDGWFHSSLCLSMCSYVLFMMVTVGYNPTYVYQCVPVFCLWWLWLVPILPMFINVFLCSVYDGWF